MHRRLRTVLGALMLLNGLLAFGHALVNTSMLKVLFAHFGTEDQLYFWSFMAHWLIGPLALVIVGSVFLLGDKSQNTRQLVTAVATNAFVVLAWVVKAVVWVPGVGLSYSLFENFNYATNEKPLLATLAAYSHPISVLSLCLALIGLALARKKPY